MAVCIKDCIQNLNLVIGCTIGCSYCYARNNVRRFHITDDFAKPEYFPNKLCRMDRARPQNILLTGMSDFAEWNPSWREEIFAKMAENPQHQYLFLTKRPENISFSSELDNAWFGVTVTSCKEKGRIATLREQIRSRHYHVTFEPIFDEIGLVNLTGIEWIAGGRLFSQSLCGLYPRLQVLLRFIYEAIYRAYRTMGDLSGCEALACH